MEASTSGDEDRFSEIYQAEWLWRRQQLGAQSSDPASPVEEFLPDVGPAAQQDRLDHWLDILGQLDKVDESRLPADAQTDLAVYRSQLEILIAQQQFRHYQRPANADTAFWTQLSSRGRRTLRTADEIESYLSQLQGIPAHFDQQIENMRAGVGRGFGPPQVAMQGRGATIDTVAETQDPRQTPFFRPFTDLPAPIPQAARERYQRAAESIIGTAVVPAYQELSALFHQEYLPALPEDIAASALPDGEAYYAATLREFTTTDLTPKAIYELGLTEVAKISDEMQTVAGELGYASVPALLAFLKSDPQFYARSPEELLRAAAWHAKQFDAVVGQFFGRLPRMRFGIEEPPADLAPFFTFGRGGPGRYVVNTYNLPARPLYSLPALTLHEAAPGHAFQIPFALEQSHHPDFRRTSYLSAYGEGWALYAERLGVEMGMYRTRYEIMGMLSFQMWRAVRLVVDPGMHAFGWSRQQAQDYLRENTAISDHEITTEIDRYIAWPGQATAYYLGELKILELRQRAEQSLGGAFDLRNFHDAVLATGSVPLAILDSVIDRFIADGGRSPFSEHDPN